jgi:acetyl esterase/lipase
MVQAACVLTVSAVLLAAEDVPRPSTPFPGKDVPTIQAWQIQARARLFDLLMRDENPKPVPPDPQPIKTEDRGDYTLYGLRIKTLSDLTEEAWISVPRGAKPGATPAILSLHGHGGHPYRQFDPKDLYFFSDYYARRGYVVMAIDIDGHKNQRKWTCQGWRVWTSLRALDYLCKRPEVNPDKLGVVGLSTGAFTTVFVMALDERPKLAVMSGGLISFRQMWEPALNHCKCQVIPGLGETFDHTDIIAMAAPRAFCFQNGKRDTIFPWKDGVDAFQKLQAMWAYFNAYDKLVYDMPDGGHAFVVDVPTYWLERYLRE